MAEKKPDRKKGFQEEIEALEEIVRSLESNDLDLDKALELFDDGVKRLKSAREKLQKAESVVKRIVKEADGTLSEDEVDV